MRTRKIKAEYRELASPRPWWPNPARRMPEGRRETISAEYDFPFLAHAPMEPSIAPSRRAAMAWRCGSVRNFRPADQGAIANHGPQMPEQVKLNTMIAGGGFGRRAQPDSAYLVEASAEIAKDAKVPVKVVWTRGMTSRAATTGQRCITARALASTRRQDRRVGNTPSSARILRRHAVPRRSKRVSMPTLVEGVSDQRPMTSPA